MMVRGLMARDTTKKRRDPDERCRSVVGRLLDRDRLAAAVLESSLELFHSLLELEDLGLLAHEHLRQRVEHLLLMHEPDLELDDSSVFSARDFALGLVLLHRGR